MSAPSISCSSVMDLRAGAGGRRASRRRSLKFSCCEIKRAHYNCEDTSFGNIRVEISDSLPSNHCPTFLDFQKRSLHSNAQSCDEAKFAQQSAATFENAIRN
ncbi:hypothetical protein EVAR_32085_1 [Eumeta japonica]|uniref:Uncharacterized protein n=1 Tax=Eumeta variegata TaxID=151549 RepID=A0A4C1V5Q6_EUMVA|nr:hypothetical protein EVAR_32085_1 [Eumeta japonica]